MLEYRVNTVDIHTLVAFLNETRSDIRSQVDFGEYAKKIVAKACVIELWIDGVLAGISACYMNDSYTYRAYLTQLIIKSSFRGKGYGRKLLNRTEMLAARYGMQTLQLEVFCANMNGKSFYQRMGYSFIETRKDKQLMSKRMANKMHKLLMLGTSNGSLAIINYAKSVGIYTIVTDYLEPEFSAAKQIADEYWMINTADVDALEERARAEGVNAVISGINSFNTLKAMELARRMNLPYYCTQQAWDLTGDGDKSEFKRICRECNAPVAKDYFLSDDLTEEEVATVQFPVVVKPVDKGANTGISFCHNAEELREAFRLVRKVSMNPHIVVERMLHGEEWYSSYAIKNGEIRFLALDAMYSEPGYPTCCYTITTTVANHIEQYLEEVNPQIEEVLRRVGCTNGYAWVQVMHDEDGHFYVIEMGYRFDADLMFMSYKDMTGYDAVRAMVNYHCGIDDSDNPLPKAQEHAFKQCGCGHMFWTKRAGKITRIEGLDEIAKTIPGIYIDVRRHIGDEFEAYRPLGTIAYTARDCDHLCELIDYINRTVRIYDENEEDIIIKYTNFDYLKKVYKEGLDGK